MTTYNDTISEGISANLTDLQKQTLTLIQAIEMDDTSTSEQITRIFEAIGINDVLNLLGSNFHVSPSEVIDVADMVAILWNNTILENIEQSASEAEVIRRIQLITELVHLYDSGLSKGVLNSSIAVTLALQDLLSPHSLEVLLESVEMQDAFVDLLKQIGQVLDEITSSAALAEFVAFFTLVEDSFTDSDTVTTNANLKEYLEEGWVVTTSYTHDGVTYTGWVMNPENYALSNYSNFQFNSVARFKDDYLLASTLGLYSLGGSSDNGSYINAKLKTAAMTFGTTSQKQIPEVLLGVNNTGKVILVVTTDGQMTTTYQLDVPSAYLDTQRIKIGKGVHGRYWQFELHTLENSEFDLDTFEFFPIAWGRKIR